MLLIVKWQLLKILSVDKFVLSIFELKGKISLQLLNRKKFVADTLCVCAFLKNCTKVNHGIILLRLWMISGLLLKGFASSPMTLSSRRLKSLMRLVLEGRNAYEKEVSSTKA